MTGEQKIPLTFSYLNKTTLAHYCDNSGITEYFIQVLVRFSF